MGRSNKAPDTDGDFYNAPYFNFNDENLKFNTNDVDNPNDNYGSASAFVVVVPWYVTNPESPAITSGTFVIPIVSSLQAFSQSLGFVPVSQGIAVD